MTDDYERMYEYVTADLGVQIQAVDLVCDINGCSEETMHDILWAVSGERMFPWEAEDDED